MKNSNLKFIAVILFSLIFASCSLIEDIFESDEISNEEKQKIVASIKSYSIVNDSILLTENPASGFQALLIRYENDPLVEKAELNESGLFLKYKNGGVISWLLTVDDDNPPYWKSGKIVNENLLLKSGDISENTVGNKKVAIMNQQSNDESRETYLEYYIEAEKEFTNHGFEVTRFDASDITLNFISKDMKNYGTFYFITHGGYATNNTWICTGQTGNVEQMLDLYNNEWLDGQISIGNIEEERNGESVSVSYYSFSEDFITESYKQNDFPNSFLYLTACQALKNTSRLADSFVNAGCGVFVGWNETNSLGKHTGLMLFDYLLGGKLLLEAYEGLPTRAKIENRITEVEEGEIGEEYTAELKFYPESKTDFYLVSEEIKSKIVITSHSNNEHCSNRVQKIEGYMEGVDEIDNALIELNGVPLDLKISGKTHFIQTVVLQDGNNSIKIVAKGRKDVNKTSVQEKELNIKGDFPALDLFTELRWNTDNTDVDMHLLPPGASVNDLFTTYDCFYDFRKTAWNAYLDVDERHGFGPEHITIPSVIQSGTYSLYVHYYENHNSFPLPTSIYIDVTTLNNNGICIGPLAMDNPRIGINSNNHGDLIKVCEITFPEGKIKVLNEIVPLLKSASKNIPLK